MDWRKLIDENGHAEIPYGTTEIEYSAFQHCSNLRSVEIPNATGLRVA